jgi:hypothetical protein
MGGPRYTAAVKSEGLAPSRATLRPDRPAVATASSAPASPHHRSPAPRPLRVSCSRLFAVSLRDVVLLHPYLGANAFPAAAAYTTRTALFLVGPSFNAL